jgi:hypothetical protein
MNSDIDKILERWERVSAYFFVLLIITGCIHQSNVVQDSTHSDYTQRAIDYYRWLKSSPEVVVKRERHYLEQQPEELDPVVCMARLALVSSISIDTTGQDERHALKLLEQVINTNDSISDPVRHDYQKFSLLWRDVLDQRQRLRLGMNKADDGIAAGRQQIQTLQEENAALQKQIEALKSIEQQLNRREQTREIKP